MNPNENAYRKLKQWQKALGLTDGDTGLAEVQPELTDPNKPKPEDLELYEEMFLEAAQRQIPLQERDRKELEYFRQVFHLRDEDVFEIEQRLMAELEIPPDAYPDAYSNIDFMNPAVPPQQRSSQPIDSYSAEGSNAPTIINQPGSANRAALQNALKRMSERNPANIGQTQPPNEFAARSPSNTDTPSTPPPASTPVVPPATPAAQEPTAAPVTAPAQTPETVVQPAESTVESAPQVQPIPATPAPPVTSVLPSTPVAVPVAAEAAAPPKRRLVLDKRVLIPFFAFLAGLTGLAVIWLMARPYLQPSQPNPQASQQYLQQGTQKSQANNYQGAIADFDEAIRLAPEDVNAYINRGYAYHRLGNLSAAANDYNKAIQLNPNSAEAHSNLSHVRFDQRNYNEAAKLAQRAIELKNNFPEAHLNLGNALAAQNEVDSASQQFQTVLQLPASNSTKARAHNNRGNIFFARNNFSEAGKEYDQAIKLDPNYADALYNRGLVYQRTDNQPAAIQDFNDAARLYKAQGSDRRAEEAQRRAEQLRQTNPSTAPPPTQTPNTQSI
ncbi:MAG: tetratricopeptide repeat protein [Oscillatoriales cyanobacterium C42_A2020_001]|nr:tetratricopeptide repeat protein [Leptolyngbyaceae cyanobacterium C42_A2020_001]